MFDSITRIVKVIHTENVLWICVAHRLQSRELSLLHLFPDQGLAHLNIYGSISCHRNEIYLLLPNASNGHLISTATQLKINKILEDMPEIPRALAQKCVP